MDRNGFFFVVVLFLFTFISLTTRILFVVLSVLICLNCLLTLVWRASTPFGPIVGLVYCRLLKRFSRQTYNVSKIIMVGPEFSHLTIPTSSPGTVINHVEPQSNLCAAYVVLILPTLKWPFGRQKSLQNILFIFTTGTCQITDVLVRLFRQLV